MIVIISEETDLHSLSVAKCIYDIDPLAQVAIIDAQDFPTKAQLTISVDNWRLKTADGRIIKSEDVKTVWWRRSLAHNISKSIHDPTAKHFSANESAHAFRAIAYWPTYRVINDVENERRATCKPLQHHVAHKIGLNVPEVIVSNDGGEVKNFYQSHESVVFKVMTTPISLFAETRRFRSEHLGKLDSLAHSPVIFQREIKKLNDVRVTVVGDKVFAATVKGNLSRGSLFPDWRMDATAECTEIILPADISDLSVKMIRELGLDYGTVDFVQDEDGTYFFLEVNPSGQYLFVEIDTGQPISSAMAKLLVNY